MKAKLVLGARIILGIIFVVFGLNGFLHFIPMPEMSVEASMFMGALADSGYFFPVLKATEIVAGILLLADLYVPLALLLLAPITLHIFLFHVFMDMSGLPLGVIAVLLNAFLGHAYLKSYNGVLTKKAKPAK